MRRAGVQNDMGGRFRADLEILRGERRGKAHIHAALRKRAQSFTSFKDAALRRTPPLVPPQSGGRELRNPPVVGR